MECGSSYEVAVIGLGLIGSAACRHLALRFGSSVVGIGPAEPLDWGAHTGVFASHYDQARITRIVDRNDVWSKLAARSIASYNSIQHDSGISFHHPVGSLRVTPFFQQQDDTLLAAYHTGRSNGAAVELLESGAQLKNRFPYFGFEDSHAGVMEAGPAGYINPRALVKAQLAIAANHGVDLVMETVVKLEGDENSMRIHTDCGRVLVAARVLICADAYTNLLVRDPLAMATQLVSVLLAEVDTSEAENLKDMPSVIWRLRNHPFLHSLYACPPVRYPDGRTYVKLGGTERKPYIKSEPEDFVEWFHSAEGRPDETQAFREVIAQLLPETSFKSFSRKPCMVTYTAHEYPYIGAVDGKKSESEAQVFVCTGGGTAAKCSDEIGRIGALLVADKTWNYDLDQSLFAPVFAATGKFDAKGSVPLADHRTHTS